MSTFGTSLYYSQTANTSTICSIPTPFLSEMFETAILCCIEVLHTNAASEVPATFVMAVVLLTSLWYHLLETSSMVSIMISASQASVWQLSTLSLVMLDRSGVTLPAYIFRTFMRSLSEIPLQPLHPYVTVRDLIQSYHNCSVRFTETSAPCTRALTAAAFIKADMSFPVRLDWEVLCICLEHFMRHSFNSMKTVRGLVPLSDALNEQVCVEEQHMLCLRELASLLLCAFNPNADAQPNPPYKMRLTLTEFKGTLVVLEAHCRHAFFNQDPAVPENRNSILTFINAVLMVIDSITTSKFISREKHMPLLFLISTIHKLFCKLAARTLLPIDQDEDFTVGSAVRRLCHILSHTLKCGRLSAESATDHRLALRIKLTLACARDVAGICKCHLPSPRAVEALSGRKTKWMSVERKHARRFPQAGQLLAHCCSINCVNLAGVSDSLLPRQLCSGCRRASYCAVECQRAAWRLGHKSVCGEWAIRPGGSLNGI